MGASAAQERDSVTLRKYRFCEEDEWSKDEAQAADSLLAALKRAAEKQRETLRLGSGCVVDDDTWLWGQHETCRAPGAAANGLGRESVGFV